MLLDTSKYSFKYYHYAKCSLCGKMIVPECESKKEVRYYNVPAGIKKSIASHVSKHWIDYLGWDDKYRPKLRELGVWSLEEVIGSCYYVVYDNEKSFQQCMKDLQQLRTAVKGEEREPLSSEDMKELKKTIANLSFTVDQKMDLKKIIDDIDNISTEMFRKKRSCEIVESGRSVYYTGFSGIPGLGKKY